MNTKVQENYGSRGFKSHPNARYSGETVACTEAKE
jgi:hypothetical protein